MTRKTLTQFAMNEPDAFVAWCDKLRAAGVGKLGALVLVAKPPSATHDRKEHDPEAEARRKHEIMFAATRIRPPFVAPAPSDAGTPRMRQARDEAGRGSAKS